MPYVIDLHKSFRGSITAAGDSKTPRTMSAISPLAENNQDEAGRVTPTIREMPGSTTWSKYDMSPPPLVWEGFERVKPETGR
jgi:hypothetical protein